MANKTVFMCPCGISLHSNDPTSYLILSSHLLIETMEPSCSPSSDFTISFSICSEPLFVL